MVCASIPPSMDLVYGLAYRVLLQVAGVKQCGLHCGGRIYLLQTGKSHVCDVTMFCALGIPAH